MNCKFCGAPLPEVKTGKRPREYCNNAHKQADYRRRHGQGADITALRKELAIAQARIQELERLMPVPSVTVQKKKEKAAPLVNLWEFAGLHQVAVTDAQRNIAMGMLKPTMIDGVEMLDAEGQHAFWQLNHDYKKGIWKDCPDCPHMEEFKVVHHDTTFRKRGM